MSEDITSDCRRLTRRRFLGTAAVSMAAAQFGMFSPVDAPPNTAQGANRPTIPGTSTSFGPVKQIKADILNVGYVEAGPATGQAVMLLHGWPYDIHSYIEFAPLLASAGYRVIVPYFRGYGTTTFLSSATARNVDQAAFALDIHRVDGCPQDRAGRPCRV